MNRPLSDQLSKCQIDDRDHGKTPHQEQQPLSIQEQLVQQDSNDQRQQLQVGLKKMDIPCNLDSYQQLQVQHNQCALTNYIPVRRSFPTPDEEIELKLRKFSKHVFDEENKFIKANIKMFKDLNIEPKFYHAAINRLLKDCIARDDKSRETATQVVSLFFSEKIITKSDYLHAFQELAKITEQLLIDRPELFKYMATFNVMLLKQRHINLVDVRNVVQSILPEYGAAMAKETLLQYEVLYRKDATVRLWYESSLNPIDFFKMGSPEAADKYLIDAQLGYLLDFDTVPVTDSDSERLDGFVKLIVEKAISEPVLCESYAKMCKEVNSLLNVPSSTEKRPLSFKSLLVGQCQKEFENGVVDDKAIPNINPAQKEYKERKAQIERTMQLRAVGTVRFIGELYNQGQLTSSIMCSCMNQLIKKYDEGYDEKKLECLCNLLTTIGSKMEDNVQNLSPYLTKMEEIALNKDKYRISATIRRLLQDVINLSSYGWRPKSAGQRDHTPRAMNSTAKKGRGNTGAK